MSSVLISTRNDVMLMTESEACSSKVADSSMVLMRENRRFITVPTRHCLLMRVSVEAKNARDLNAAIPYALEDQLADPVEDLHFSYAPKSDDGQRAVIVCHRDVMQLWHDEFISVDGHIIPDALALPIQPGGWTIVLGDDRALVRTGKYTGFECQPDQLENLLRLSSNGLASPETIDCWSKEGGSEMSFSESSLASLVQTHHFNSFEEWLQFAGQPVEDIDLRTGMFSRGRKVISGPKAWLPTLVLLAIALFLHVYLSITEISELTASTRALNQQSETLFNNAFPDVKKIVNMRVQAEQELKQLEAGVMEKGSNFIAVFTDSMSAVADLKGVALKGFNWQKETMQLQLTASSINLVELLKQRLQSKNYSVEILNAVNSKDGLRAQLRIKP